jgi:hypothetical protein
MSEQIFRITAKFVHADTGAPVTGPGLRVRFFDRDTLKDDLLGESALAADGSAAVLTTTSAFRSGLMGAVGKALGESKPDLYCEVVEHGKAIFRTKVAWNTPVGAVDPVTKQAEHTVDLGTFRVTRGAGFDEEGYGEKIGPFRPRA